MQRAAPKNEGKRGQRKKLTAVRFERSGQEAFLRRRINMTVCPRPKSFETFRLLWLGTSPSREKLMEIDQFTHWLRTERYTNSRKPKMENGHLLTSARRQSRSRGGEAVLADHF